MEGGGGYGGGWGIWRGVGGMEGGGGYGGGGGVGDMEGGGGYGGGWGVDYLLLISRSIETPNCNTDYT